MRELVCLTIIGWMAAPVSAITLDGSITDDGYSTRALQTIQTGFGGGFNELDGAYTVVDGINLNVAITGKIEGFNKLMLFIDSVPGGENVLSKSTGSGGNNVASDGWADKMGGFIFDEGVAPDYLLIARNGYFEGDRYDFNFSTVGSAAVDEETFDIFSGSVTGSNSSVGSSGIGVAYDNSLTGGSIGDSVGEPAINPGAITSGNEFSIPLAAIGSPDLANIKITAFLNNSNFDYGANQTLGGLPLGFGNLADDGSGGTSQIDLSSYDGDQFFTVIPEPSSLPLVGLSLAVLLGVSRRHS